MDNLIAVVDDLKNELLKADPADIEGIMALKAKADSQFASYVKGIKARVFLDRDRARLEAEIKERQDKLAELEAQAGVVEVSDGSVQ